MFTRFGSRAILSASRLSLSRSESFRLTSSPLLYNYPQFKIYNDNYYFSQQSNISTEEIKQKATGFKDQVIGTMKEKMGGAMGNTDMKKEGQEQKKAGEENLDADQMKQDIKQRSQETIDNLKAKSEDLAEQAKKKARETINKNT